VTGATSIGSLHAMSPEQLRGDGLAPSSDLFAVGVLLYECLTGRVPFPGATPAEVAAAHERGPAASPSHLAPDVAERLDDVVGQALRLDPERRFASAPAMANALRTAAAGRDVAATPTHDDDTTSMQPVVPPRTAAPQPGSGRSGPPRRPWMAVTAGVAMVAAVLLGALLLGSPQAGGRSSATARPSPSASADAQPSLAPGMVRVPATIGMSEAEAQAAAEAAGLAWRIEWQIVTGREPGIHAQDPEAGAVVRAGSAFVMQAYRDR
jgi:serine/threonine-protein kinase